MLPLLAGAASKLLLPSAKKKSGAEVASAITNKKSKQSDTQSDSDKKSSPIIKTISTVKLLDLKVPDSNENAIVKSDKPGGDFKPIDDVNSLILVSFSKISFSLDSSILLFTM